MCNSNNASYGTATLTMRVCVAEEVQVLLDANREEASCGPSGGDGACIVRAGVHMHGHDVASGVTIPGHQVRTRQRSVSCFFQSFPLFFISHLLFSCSCFHAKSACQMQNNHCWSRSKYKQSSYIAHRRNTEWPSKVGKKQQTWSKNITCVAYQIQEYIELENAQRGFCLDPR